MKTASIILFTADLLKVLYRGFTKVAQEKGTDKEELEIKEENRRTVHWQPYVGIGMLLVAGAFLVYGRKKSPMVL
jgi:hypothetical protein